MYNAELQQLREFFWFWGRLMRCYFCKKPLIDPKTVPINLSWGHRRHIAIRVKVSNHHIDENRSNNSDHNMGWAHRACHKTHHRKIHEKGGLHGSEEEIEEDV